MNFALLITAAGSSVRFGKKKEFLPLSIHDKSVTVLSASLETFLRTDLFTVCVITIPEGSQKDAEQAIKTVLPFANEKKIPIFFIEGGTTRQKSVYQGLQLLKKYSLQNTSQKVTENFCLFDAVMIHDGARPWVTTEIILDAAFVTKKHGAAVPAIQAIDTCKETTEDGKIKRHLKRSSIFSVQTPQSFLFEPLFQAHKKAADDNQIYTDDTEIWAAYAGDVYISHGDYANKKITFVQDLLP